MSRKLKFDEEENTPTSKPKKTKHTIENLEKKSRKTSDKLNKARDKIPSKKKVKKQRIFNEKAQKAKSKLVFEKEDIPINETEWNNPKKQSLPQKSVAAVKSVGINKLHSKVYEVEHENVGTQSAHRGELLSESAYRESKKLTHSAYRFAKNSPYRKVAKLEVKSIKADMKLSYQKVLRDKPKLASNPISRMFQKRSIKKEYVTAIRNAKKSGKTAKKAVGIAQRTRQAVTEIVRKNPVFLLKAGILLLIIFMLLALLSMCGTLFSGGTAFVRVTSYTAEDTDIEQSELSYTEWETDLLLEIQNAESTHSGYDEYRYQIDNTRHDPFELMGYLTAVYGDFAYEEIENILHEIFNEQYKLDYIPEVEVRTRTETRTDTYVNPQTGETNTYSYEVEVEYEWRILNVSLTSQSLNDVIVSRMNDEQHDHFEILMQSNGNRQFVSNPFDFDWLSYVTDYYGYRIHPISGERNYHRGIDIGVPTGTEIKTGFDGTVTISDYDDNYGNYVVIEMRKDDGTVIETKYAHCDTLTVSVGQIVKKGDVIAKVGNTGNSTGPHLHLELVKDGEYLNPIYFVGTSVRRNP